VEGLFEITGKDRDAVLLFNFLDELTYLARSNLGRRAFKPLHKGMLLIGRLVPADGDWLVSGHLSSYRRRPGTRCSPSPPSRRYAIPKRSSGTRPSSPRRVGCLRSTRQYSSACSVPTSSSCRATRCPARSGAVQQPGADLPPPLPRAAVRFPGRPRRIARAAAAACRPRPGHCQHGLRQAPKAQARLLLGRRWRGTAAPQQAPLLRRNGAAPDGPSVQDPVRRAPAQPLKPRRDRGRDVADVGS
jgi:hypothetical protein